MSNEFKNSLVIDALTAMGFESKTIEMIQRSDTMVKMLDQFVSIKKRRMEKKSTQLGWELTKMLVNTIQKLGFLCS